MSLILSLETATPVCSVALHKEGKLVGLNELHLSQSHSALLGVLVEDVIRYAGYSLSDIDLIAVSKGPGSYTGLRIGTASAKGLCFALDIPLVAVNTLEAMAYGVAGYRVAESYISGMRDGRRRKVYTQEVNKKMNTILPTRHVVVEDGAFEENIKNLYFLFFRERAARCINTLCVTSNAKFNDNIT